MKIRVLSLVAVACLSLPSAALAQGPADAGAEVHLRRGQELARDGDWDAALAELRRAYTMEPRWQTLYEIGRAAAQLRRYADALDAFEKVLAEGGAEVPADRREDARREIEKLRTRVATVMVITPGAGVEISIDDVPAGKTPLAAPLRVSAGHRKVTATRKGAPPVSQVVELAGGDAKRITLDLPEAGPVAKGVTPEPPAEPPAPPAPAVPAVRRYTWLPWLLTAGLGAGAIGTGVLALQASSDLKTKLATYPVLPSDLHAAHAKTQALAVAADALTAGTILLGGLSIYYTVSQPAPSDKPAAGAVRIHAGPLGVRVSGTF